MKFDQTYTAKQIAQWINAEVIGDPGQEFSGMNEIHKVEKGDIMFVDVAKYFKKALQSSATGIILNERIEVPEGKVLFLVDHPFEAYEKLARRFIQFEVLNKDIHETAQIHPTAQIEPGVRIAANVKIGRGSIIQANCYIGSRTEIGKDVWIQPNCTIGSEAFYFKKEKGNYRKWTSIGKVVIEDNVMIGANCCIDKGVSGETRIGQGSRLDNLVQLGHGVVIGKNCLIAAQVGIGGKTIIEDEVTIYGQVGIANSLRVGKGAILQAQSGLSKSLEGGKVYFGTPAIEARQRLKELATLRRLSKGD